ncbi:unnamed protein product [Arabidopsis lyrata]|uniref:RRM domain-containing protein n=1 Tax=Arabidopsis lyrata subsp. lyrata TaxID=81972 RepID=D7MPL0_ARALL|nr:uncharacterized protein LOC9300626 [Arabidopsis lyrata subsp. lyrata]EFH42510.1 hypothetical protein ARALYDRAFT_495917 [Arabidopsis lyrata subsp. lyrata]CAH8280074.1 unnamed protein product [Arabidopsis lyrata]|eukprot:XP_002866251.1 uncharacterized protein LOC9300626 [Arabidopsis lyrata subsp. lyrata]
MEEKSSGGGGVRLHVGGLGESVGRDDLLKIFSPMGTVDAVEFVRTKGRSFAYVDFSPSSTNSLTKLFSTYNGCVWKGGRLRLEKAKEHYLARLKREWEAASSTSDNTIKAPSDSTPSTHLNIFFPRLRKVKAMPLTGTGKHKYSFQRVPLSSSLPKSFCDCEEHSNNSLTPRETHLQDLESLNVGRNEDEVNVMNSVMNKLFEKNNIPIAEEDNEIEADQDNLIINVASSGNDMDSELDKLSRKRKSILNETTPSGEGYSEGRKGNHIHPSKKRQTISLEESGRQESSQSIREKKKPSKVVPDKSLDEPSRTTDVKQSIDNISWSQKSSWKSLMANGNSSDFSVSSFLPGVGSSKAVQPAPRNTDLAELPSRENSKEKTKRKRVTSTIMAGDLPVPDDIKRDDSDTMVDDIERDVSAAVEDDAANDSVAESDDSDAVECDTAIDSMADDTASDSMADDAASDAVAESDDSDAVEYDTAIDSMADDTASDSVADDTANDDVGSDDSESLADTVIDTSVDAVPLDFVANTEGDSGNGKSNVEKHENGAEDMNAEKGSLVVKENVVDEEEAGKEPVKACNKSTGGSSWLQKASWTQLVSDKNTSSFSITQLFPDLSSDKGEPAGVINSVERQSHKTASAMKQTDYTCSSGGFVAAGVPVASTPVRSLDENRHHLNGKNLSEGGRLGAKKIIKRKVVSGDTCTFMRSSTSLKEWAKAKKALSEPRRKKNGED